MKKAIKWLDINFEPILIMVVFIVMSCLITLQVILRFFMGSGFAWGEEISKYMFVWITFLSIPYGFRNNRQISVNFLRDKIPETARKILVLVIDVTMLVLMGIYLKGAMGNYTSAANYGDLMNSISVSMTYVYAAALVGWGLSILRIAQTIIWRVRRFKAPYELFLNFGGNYSGYLDISFMPKHLRDNEKALLSADLLEAEAHYTSSKKEAE